MQIDDIEQIDREYTYAYERDRINERVGIWSLFFTGQIVYYLTYWNPYVARWKNIFS